MKGATYALSESTRLYKASWQQRNDSVLSLYKNLFHKNTKPEIFKYGVITITENFLFGNFSLVGLTTPHLIEVYNAEIAFIKRLQGKKSTSSDFIINILVQNLSEEIKENRRLSSEVKGGMAARLKVLYGKIFDLRTCRSELKKKITKRELEKILKNPLYSIAVRALIFKSEGEKLDKDFEYYVLDGINKDPYNYKERLDQSLLIIHYLTLLTKFNFKFNGGAYPPLPSKVMECLYVIQNGASNPEKRKKRLGKVKGEISKLLDPDHAPP